ncbi:MAG TPA: hypothetical protein DEA55_07115 [Rhodospirillaceae bacterium]|nr:hypothetical protein [Rhodospirillaceae bacterium]
MTQQTEQDQPGKDLVIRDIRLFADMFNSCAAARSKVICLDNLTSQIGTLKTVFNMSSNEIEQTLGITDSLINDAYFHSALLAAHETLKQTDITVSRSEEFNLGMNINKAMQIREAAQYLETARSNAPDIDTYDKLYISFGTTPDNLEHLAREVENGKTYIAPATTTLRRVLSGAPKINIPEPDR